ncbi:MAG TPA: hypothetical protein VMT88_09785 [Actinomycetes bacterium]|nr:hypothetical protein [Actinomycetes bacterium]
MSRKPLARGSIIVGLAVALIGLGTALPFFGDDSPGTPAAASGASFVGVSSNDLTANLTALRAHLAAQPQDTHGWALLAQGYVEQARLVADPSYYSKAEEAIARSLALDSADNAAAYSARAALASARHDFALALSSAREALAINPLDQVGLAIRTDALTELGRYNKARHSAMAMDSHRPGLPATTRLAYQAELRGHLRSAAASFARAAAHSTGSDLAFALVHQANLERSLGKLNVAEHLYRNALLAHPDDPTALAGLAHMAVARGNISAATVRARDVATLLPVPENVTFYAELLLVQGKTAQARQQFAVEQATAQLAAAQGVNVDLELAQFFADHGDPRKALQSARETWAARHTVHTADALGWALHVNGKDQQALRLVKQANALGTGSAQFLQHLGIVEAALGHDAAARTHLTQALAADPGYSPWQQQNIRQALLSLDGPS